MRDNRCQLHIEMGNKGDSYKAALILCLLEPGPLQPNNSEKIFENALKKQNYRAFHMRQEQAFS